MLGHLQVLERIKNRKVEKKVVKKNDDAKGKFATTKILINSFSPVQ